ncbi:MAG: phenylacetate--CoA ligase family protein, partial [Planctomycetes bacterium]|nr:phenylacetate--CoA ligase family protein [Planctomycetota bacterium]
ARALKPGGRLIIHTSPNRLFEELAARDFWNAQQWRDYQADLLKRFVRHCYDNVPFYRDRFAARSLSPDDIQAPEDLLKLPVLTKEEVREQREGMLATNFPRRKLTRGHTTGSTGVPLTFWGDRTRSEHIVAGLWRSYCRCGWEPGERIASIWGFRDSEKAGPGWKRRARDFFSATTHLDAFDANDAEFATWFRLLKKQKPTVLVCYASSGSRFARWLIHRRETLPCIKGVFCTSERLYEYQSNLLAEAFQCKVFDLYGGAEAIHIACTCDSAAMHINPDMAVVENGEANEHGQRPLIVTGLRNWAMPFLRYANGDSACLTDGVCPCGRQSPLMELQITRLSDVFRFGDGKEYPSLYFVLRLYRAGFDGVELFQYHQDRPDHIYLRIVKNSDFTEETQARLHAVKEEIESHIGHQARLEIEYVAHIAHSSSGKHSYACSDVKPMGGSTLGCEGSV